ncbi:hypothetical protein [Psychroflexus aestuariivivens]|uniref:hypothetical protein n=1 Tax=Psychroflexus aestuariivivens TaxID=1795040 RepID=UPI000FDA659C|nr:hypothetical protein [Psychroflexus aestuariivivens]
MDFSKKYISKLLEKYDNGNSTLEEEQHLKTYFTEHDIASEFEVYRPLFAYFEQAKNLSYHSKWQPQRKVKMKPLWMKVAASFIVILGSVWLFNLYQEQQELKAAKMAFEETQQALKMISENMNQGLEKLEYVEVFSEQKNKLIK